MIRPWRLCEAARAITGGGIVAYPTEAVYGLGCDPFDDEAVQRLLRMKRRPAGLGLIVIGACFEQIAPFIGALAPEARARLDRSWPGPRTWLVPASDAVPPWIRGDHDRVALRVTAHPVAAALCATIDAAIVSTSANVHGEPAARTALGVRLRFGKSVDFVLDGPTGGLPRPTPIHDATTGQIIRG